MTPLTALINLFIYILQNPLSPSAESDIGLMYMMAGHFNYLEFATSDRSFPFVPQLANMARLAVTRARESILDPVEEGPRTDVYNMNDARDNIDGLYFNDVSFVFSHMRVTRVDADLPFSQSLLDGMNLDIGDSEQWATLVGWPDMPDSLDMITM